MDPQQIDVEMRRAQAEFHQLITGASPTICSARQTAPGGPTDSSCSTWCSAMASSGPCFP
jgi:hypothetical protein